jgi:hypothetical protein
MVVVKEFSEMSDLSDCSGTPHEVQDILPDGYVFYFVSLIDLLASI